jgi:drug/metabolite transporter (DMT)-like permease
MVEAGARAGFVAALIAATAFGVNIIGAKLSASAGLPAPLLVFYRALLMLLLVAAASAILRRAPIIDRGNWPAMAGLVLTSAGMGLAYLSSVAFIPVTVAAVVFYTYPILIVLVSPWATGHPMRPRRLAIACVAFFGVGLVVGPSFDAFDWRGLALALGASMLTVGQFIIANRVAREATLAKLFWVQLGVAPIAAVAAFASGGFAGPAALAVAPLGVVITVAGYVIGSAGVIYSLARLNAVVAGLVFCLEPVVAAIASALMLGEALALIQYAGGGLVIAAVAAAMIVSARDLKPA